jgi:hypothetical protein
MKITVETKTEQDYEIKTPSYHKSMYEQSFYYVDENVVIHVMHHAISTHLVGSILFNNQAVFASQLPEATQEQFESYFDKTIAKLISLKPNYTHDRNSIQ